MYVQFAINKTRNHAPSIFPHPIKKLAYLELTPIVKEIRIIDILTDIIIDLKINTTIYFQLYHIDIKSKIKTCAKPQTCAS